MKSSLVGLLLLGIVHPAIAFAKEGSKVSASQATSPVRVVAQQVNKPSLAEAKKLIEQNLKKKLRLGTKRAQVEARLKSQKIEAWPVPKQQLEAKEYRAALARKGYKLSQISGIIMTPTREVVRNVAFLVFTLYIFDKKNQLLDILVNQIGTEEIERVPGKPTREQMESSIKKGVALGSTPAQVAAWLEAKKIEHSPYMDGKEYDLGMESAVTRSKYHPSDLGGITQAIVRGVARGFVMEVGIQIVFFFDKQGKMIDFNVKEFGTGL